MLSKFVMKCIIYSNECKLVGLWLRLNPCISIVRKIRILFWQQVIYGAIEEILEIDYVIFKVPLFKCEWIPNSNGLQTNKLEFIQIDFGKTSYMTEPFIMAI